ncbi:hypothetical protein, partial [uncultured Dietzia sp.]|uniref:hypothetical protein n=1 Tax=uncultured Dietzia sp. TaxID=395519 RepID=UPI00260F4D9C
MIDPTSLPPRHGPDDPRGVLCFREPLPGALQDLEDSTQSADFDRAWTLGRRFQRPSTSTERDLLAALGWTDAQGNPPGPSTMTHVYVTGGIRTPTRPGPRPPPQSPAGAGGGGQ